MEQDLRDLLLRDYKPEAMLRVPVHSVPRAKCPVVDAHNHLGRRTELLEMMSRRDIGNWIVGDVGGLIGLMDECNVRTIVNLDGDWGDELEANLERYDRAFPGRFVTFCRLDWGECLTPGWPERLAASLQDSVKRGASGLKVWKDVGLHVRDESGALVLCDDQRLQPMWDVAGEAKLPVSIHIADPPAFFAPLDERNERLELLLRHPEWHFADARFPRFEVLMDALEGLVAAQPGVTFIGVHVGSNADDLGWVHRMLDTYPNVYVDVAARISDLGRQPRATRRLILQHPTRVLFGTDGLPTTRSLYSHYFRFFETDDEHFPYSDADPPDFGRWAISGLHLPDEQLVKIYSENARRVIPAVWSS